MGCPQLRYLVASLLASYGCGSGAGDHGSSLVVSQPGAESVITATFLNGVANYAIASVGDGQLLLVTVEGDDETQRLLARRFDSHLAQLGESSILSGPTRREFGGLSACGRPDGSFAAAWSDGIPFELLPQGVTLDPFNAVAIQVADGTTPGVVRLNANELGAQGAADIACLSSGDVAAVWNNRCEGWQKIGDNGVVTVHPEQCADEPPNGAYLGIFDASGAPRGDMRQVAASDDPYRATYLAEASAGELLVLSGDSLQVRDEVGDVLREATAPIAATPPWDTLTCVMRERCMLGGATTLIVDPAELANATLIEIRAEEHDTPDVVTFAGVPAAACDIDGICLIVWVLQRETTYEDGTVFENLGIYGRALNAFSGEVGEETLLLGPDPTQDRGLLIDSVGRGAFVLARAVGTGIALQKVTVE